MGKGEGFPAEGIYRYFYSNHCDLVFTDLWSAPEYCNGFQGQHSGGSGWDRGTCVWTFGIWGLEIFYSAGNRIYGKGERSFYLIDPVRKYESTGRSPFSDGKRKSFDILPVIYTLCGGNRFCEAGAWWKMGGRSGDRAVCDRLACGIFGKNRWRFDGILRKMTIFHFCQKKY